jgi:site-specific DNA-methyltransferase (adenine-specific)
VLTHGTGALNIDGCRVWTDDGANRARPPRTANAILGGGRGTNLTASEHNDAGRWPANLIHDGSGDVLAGFPSSGPSKARTGKRTGKRTGTYGEFAGQDDVVMGHDDEGGSAARFFYCAKASKRDRDEGLEHMPEVARSSEFGQLHPGTSESGNTTNNYLPRRNHHPTVKPTDLMRYLCRLITPPNGVVLDPFMGSGSTGKAAVLEGFGFIGIEREAEYVRIASARIEHAHNQHIAKRPSLSEISDLGCRDDVYKTSLTINVL